MADTLDDLYEQAVSLKQQELAIREKRKEVHDKIAALAAQQVVGPPTEGDVVIEPTPASLGAKGN